jgi:quercetin dioxygenase-like cupin family protein
MPFYHLKDREAKKLADGVSVKTFWGERMLTSVFTAEAGTAVPMHSHPHEQIGFVLEGRGKLIIGDKEEIVEPGVLLVIPSNIPHGGERLQEKLVILDFFSPVREEYKY